MASEATLRVKVPCADEGEFDARLAGRLAAHGLRVPSEERPAIGSRARVALELRDGGVLVRDAVVEEHVVVDSRPGVKVRLLDRELPADAPGAPRTGAPATDLAQELFADVGDARTGALAFTVSTEIAAAVARRTHRVQRAALVVAAIAVVVALAGFAVHRWSTPATPDAAAAAPREAAVRLLRPGRVPRNDGARDHQLAAQRLRPDDPATARQLDRVADMLERLAAGALDRGDLAVAAIHLASARAAAPDRPGLRAKQEELERRARVAAAR